MARKDYLQDLGETARRYSGAGTDLRLWGKRRIPRAVEGSQEGPPHSADAKATAQWWRERLEHVLGVRSSHIRVDVDRDTVYLSGHLPRALALALRAAIDANEQEGDVHNLVEIERWSS